MKLLPIVTAASIAVVSGQEDHDHAPGVEGCDVTVQEVLDAFNALEATTSEVDPEPEAALFSDTPKVVFCNETHFTARTDGLLETFPVDFFQETDGENCYYVACEVTHHDEHGGAENVPAEVRVLQEGEHDHEHSYTLVVGHAFSTCDASPLDSSDFHHVCALTFLTPSCSQVNGVLESIFEDADFVNEIHPEGAHEHGDDEHEHGDRLLQEEHDHLEDYFFLGCNSTHVDFLFERHIYTYALTDLQNGSASCLEVDATEGECLVSLCVTGHDHGGHGDEHDHGDEHNHERLLQHDHEHEHGVADLDGVNLRVNEQFYLAGYVLYTAVVDGCCPNDEALLAETAELFTDSFASCELDEVFNTVALDAGDEENDDILLVVGGIGFLGVVIIIPTILFLTFGKKGNDLSNKQGEVVATEAAEPEKALPVTSNDAVAAKIEAEADI